MLPLFTVQMLPLLNKWLAPCDTSNCDTYYNDKSYDDKNTMMAKTTSTRATSILQILPSFDAGGVERVTFETVAGLASDGCKHHVASAGGRYAGQLPVGVTHHVLALKTKNPFKMLINVVRLYRLIKREGITLVHARSRAPAWSAFIACAWAKVPFITTYHGTYNGVTGHKRIINSIMARGDRVVAILQILPSFDAGGVERVTFETVAGLASDGCKHHVASAGGRYARQLPVNVTHHVLALKTKNPFTLLANAVRLYLLIKREGITLVHARSRAPAWSAILACAWLKVPFITTYHGTYNGVTGLKRIYNSIMARGDRVVAISRFILNHIERTHPTLIAKLTFIPEGIDTQYFNPALMTPDRIAAARCAFDVPAGSVVLLLPGRLTRWKGQAWFLRALRNRLDWLSARTICVVIIGDAQGRAEYVDALVRLANDLAIGGVPVRFITEYNDLPAAYALADVVFSCSLEPEAFGRIAAEALAMGRPFIGTNHGGTVELTGDGCFGSIVNAGDDDALLAEIERTLNDDQTALVQRGIVARAHIESNYSLAQMLQLTRELYASI